MLLTIRTLIFGLAASIALACSFEACAGDDPEHSRHELPYPAIADTSHATPRPVQIIEGFLAAKSLHEAARMVSFFAPAPQTVLYVDAGLGLTWPSQSALLDIWSSPAFANAPADALSYPLRIIGDRHSVLVEFVDTPTLLGAEYRFLASITFDEAGKIVRWVDYWDGRSSEVNLPVGTLGPYPADFHDNIVNASEKIQQVARALQSAFDDGDARAAAQLFTADAVFEDLALHTRLEGKLQIQRYLKRGLARLPYGMGASITHVVGGEQGGGYEWRAAPSATPIPRGNTAIELDRRGKITRFTTIYDSYQLSHSHYESLVTLGAEN